MENYVGGVLALALPVTYGLIIYGCARVGRNKGGSAFNWGFLAFLFPFIVPVILWAKRPRGFWKYIDRSPTEDEQLIESVRKFG